MKATSHKRVAYKKKNSLPHFYYTSLIVPSAPPATLPHKTSRVVHCGIECVVGTRMIRVAKLEKNVTGKVNEMSWRSSAEGSQRELMKFNSVLLNFSRGESQYGVVDGRACLFMIGSLQLIKDLGAKRSLLERLLCMHDIGILTASFASFFLSFSRGKFFDIYILSFFL